MTLTACWSDWALVCFLCIICSDWIFTETDCIGVFFNDHLDMSIRWFSRSAWSDWLLTKIDCLLIKSDEKESDFIVNSTVNSKMQIKTLSIKSDVESVVSDVEDWLSYSLRSDDVVIAIICFCEDSNNKYSKSETRMLF